MVFNVLIDGEFDSGIKTYQGPPEVGVPIWNFELPVSIFLKLSPKNYFSYENNTLIFVWLKSVKLLLRNDDFKNDVFSIF